MRKPINYRSTASDLLQAQLIWTFWFLGIVFLVGIIQNIFSAEMDAFYNRTFIASNIYMLVIGIIAVYFLPFFVGQGVTRKNYYIGNLIASACLSVIIPLISYVVSLLERLVSSGFRPMNFDEIPDADGNFIGDLIQSIILTPYADVETNPLLSIAIFSLNIFVFYLIGWLIGTAFYRLGVIGGLLIIAVAVGLLVAKDIFLRTAMDLPLFPSFNFFGPVPEAIAFLLVFLIIIVTALLTFLLTKRAPIKM